MTCSGVFALGHVVRAIGIYHGWVRSYCLFLVAVSSRHVVIVWFNHQSPRPQSLKPNMVTVMWSNYQGISSSNLAWQSNITICSTQAICDFFLSLLALNVRKYVPFFGRLYPNLNKRIPVWVESQLVLALSSPCVDVQHLLTLIHKSNCCACINIVWWLDPHVLILKAS